MRRRKEVMDKLRVKILEDRRAGLTYEQIQRKRGVSSRTIAKLVKGKDLKRFCQMCGETDPEKLEQHHPDKENFPNYTVTLCANCHAKVTRKQMREKAKEKKNELMVWKNVSDSNPSFLVQRVINRPQPPNIHTRPLTPEEKKNLEKILLYSLGGVATGKALFDKNLPSWVRVLLGIGAGACFYAGSKIK